jgi:hypothetical protein
MITNFFYPSLLLLFLDPGSGMVKNQDTGIRYPRHENSVPDPRSGAFLASGSVIWDSFYPDPGSRFQKNYC